MNRINYIFAKVSKCGTTELADFKSELKNLDPNSQKGRHRLGLAETIVLFSLHLSASLIALRLASIFYPPLQKLNVFFILLNIFFCAGQYYDKKFFEMQRDKFFGRSPRWWWNGWWWPHFDD